MISQITTFSKNSKLGQTADGLTYSLMCIVAQKCNWLTYSAIRKHRIKYTELVMFSKMLWLKR